MSRFIPLTDRELQELDAHQLVREYTSLRLAYEDARFNLERARHVHEGPNGTPRSRSDVSPNSRLTATLGERTKGTK